MTRAPTGEQGIGDRRQETNLLRPKVFARARGAHVKGHPPARGAWCPPSTVTRSQGRLASAVDSHPQPRSSGVRRRRSPAAKVVWRPPARIARRDRLLSLVFRAARVCPGAALPFLSTKPAGRSGQGTKTRYNCFLTGSRQQHSDGCQSQSYPDGRLGAAECVPAAGQSVFRVRTYDCLQRMPVLEGLGRFRTSSVGFFWLAHAAEHDR
jgi:hypothetical protein